VLLLVKNALQLLIAPIGGVLLSKKVSSSVLITYCYILPRRCSVPPVPPVVTPWSRTCSDTCSKVRSMPCSNSIVIAVVLLSFILALTILEIENILSPFYTLSMLLTLLMLPLYPCQAGLKMAKDCA
jgi:hypothetical protein